MSPDDFLDKTEKVAVSLEQARQKFDATKEEATDAVRDVRNNLSDALNISLEQRPHTTLLLALGVGFALGALWRS